MKIQIFYFNLKFWFCSLQLAEPKTCPECRQAVTMSRTRRIYFNFSSVIDNLQGYLDYLNLEITDKNNKLYMAKMQLDQLKNDWASKLREKDHEIQRLYDKLKHREQDYNVQKLHAKIEKLKTKIREVTFVKMAQSTHIETETINAFYSFYTFRLQSRHKHHSHPK